MARPDIERLAELEAAATAGPWEGEQFSFGDRNVIQQQTRRAIASVWAHDNAQADATFIAAIRTYARPLLEYVLQLEAERDTLRKMAPAVVTCARCGEEFEPAEEGLDCPHLVLLIADRWNTTI